MKVAVAVGVVMAWSSAVVEEHIHRCSCVGRSSSRPSTRQTNTDTRRGRRISTTCHRSSTVPSWLKSDSRPIRTQMASHHIQTCSGCQARMVAGRPQLLHMSM